MNHAEDNEQAALFKWLDENNVLAFAIPNGGARNIVTAANMKRTGTKRGVPDVFIPIPTEEYHGLFIEMKRANGGTVSEHQKWWIEMLRYAGYRVEVCHGADKAVEIVKEYMKMLPGVYAMEVKINEN